MSFFIMLVVLGASVVLAVGAVMVAVLLAQRHQGPPAGPRVTVRQEAFDKAACNLREERQRLFAQVSAGQLQAEEAERQLAELERQAPSLACPYCAEAVRPEAIKCKHCGSYLVPDAGPRRLYRSRDRIFTGVCGGLGEYLGVDPTLVRLMVAVVTFCLGIVPGLIVYLVAAMIIPEA